MLPKLSAEAERRRRAYKELHNIVVILSIEFALAVYLVSGYLADGFTIEWIISVIAFNYVAVTILANWRWFKRRMSSKR